MSRTYRDPRYTSWAYGIDSKDRRLGNRRWRSRNKQRLKMGLHPLLQREVNNKYNWPSDGGKFYDKDWVDTYISNAAEDARSCPREKPWIVGQFIRRRKRGC